MPDSIVDLRAVRPWLCKLGSCSSRLHEGLNKQSLLFMSPSASKIWKRMVYYVTIHPLLLRLASCRFARVGLGLRLLLAVGDGEALWCLRRGLAGSARWSSGEDEGRRRGGGLGSASLRTSSRSCCSLVGAMEHNPSLEYSWGQPARSRWTAARRIAEAEMA